MKKIIKYLPVLFLFYSCFFTPDPNPYSGIKSMVQYEFYIEDVVTSMSENGEIQTSYVISDTSRILEQLFNEDGKIIEESIINSRSKETDSKIIYEYHPNGNISTYKEYRYLELLYQREYRDDYKITYNFNRGRITTYTYDSHGNITNELSDSDSLMNHNYNFEYDDNNNITHSYYYDRGSLVVEYIFNNSYNLQGNLSEINYKRFNYYDERIDTLSFRRIYNYISSGLKVTHYTYNQGQYTGFSEIFFNKNDQLTKRVYFNEKNQVVCTYDDYIFNDDYKILEYTITDSINSIIQQSLEYGFSNGRLTQIHKNSNGTDEVILEVFYDNNNLIEYITSDHFYIGDINQSFAVINTNRFDPYFSDSYLFNTYDWYYYNLSDSKFQFKEGHFKFNNYDNNGIWATKIEYDLDSGNPITLFIQEYEMY